MSWSQLQKWAREWWLLLIPGAFAIGAVLAYILTFQSLPATESPGAWGTFGDFIGGLLNPLVSVLTLFVAISVWKLQKAELELTRNEMAQTKLAMEEQAETAEQQRRQQRFFDLFNVYQQTLATISLSANAGGTVIDMHGRRAFSHILSTRANMLTQSTQMLFANTGPTRPEWSPGAPDGMVKADWDSISTLIDHYFRVLFTILREAEPILESEHVRYIKMLRAQLSRDELLFVAMNVVYDSEGMKMRSLVAKYGLLKHLPPCHLRTIAEKALPPKSFGLTWATHNLLTPLELNNAP